MKTSGNTILLTGGGSGIGRELARRWAEAGNTVIIAGRRLDALEETAQGNPSIHPVQFDASDGAATDAFVTTLLDRFPALNVLVNNAGIMRQEDPRSRRDLSDAEATVTTNLLGPIRLIDALIDYLSAQPDSVIVNVTSGLATVPQPLFATYSATKAALHSYTVSLRNRLKGKVEVIELVPPGVQTDLTPGQATRPGYMPLAEFVDEVISLFAQQPTPSEILVERVKGFRFAERDGTVEEKAEILANMPR
ncbi:SDR family oxidoreductase [Sphingomonas sp. BN140010]|uniref:SDR family oxidoreductase n=1 Tax=Sphingomonas arvum TaxID=2992113 RepID=A0ABT3JCP3_9SPHN|nr:SDR family oxidoreductase [Sphingomonas sp. BN140010]MCW3796853.1 SDR family oxidoreductase [Sphingomonas sp. BN140010]